MKKFLLIFVAISMLLLVGCNANKNTNISDDNQNILDDDAQNQEQELESIAFKPSIWTIQFDEHLLGENFVKSGNEIKMCDYQIKFMEENKVSIYMNEGNYVEGTYSVIGNKIECQLTSCYSEYSPSQEIEAKIDFKINSESEIEIINNTEKYTVRVAEIDDELGWKLTEETKELELWPLVNGIKYICKQNDTEDTIKNLFLAKLKALDNNNSEKLLDYRVDKVEILSNSQDFIDLGYNSNDIRAYVTYSVKPQNVTATAWIAGNGEVEGEWIINKVACECLREGKLIDNTALNTGW
ncbi:MAG: hypothetical protein IKK43_04940 [Clostridia bacterium]|nr:hypothetical protein [Clostridia bacterium]